MNWIRRALLVGAAGTLTACSSSNSETLSAELPPVTRDAATRYDPVVPGRPARFFVFAAVGADCASLPPPEITVVQQPSKGKLSFIMHQKTTITASVHGTCADRVATGTAVYYTAHDGAEGADRFAVSAKLDGNDSTTRSFEVTIAQ